MITECFKIIVEMTDAGEQWWMEKSKSRWKCFYLYGDRDRCRSVSLKARPSRMAIAKHSRCTLSHHCDVMSNFPVNVSTKFSNVKTGQSDGSTVFLGCVVHDCDTR